MKNLKITKRFKKSKSSREPLNLQVFAEPSADPAGNQDAMSEPATDQPEESSGDPKPPAITPEVQAIIDNAIGKEKARLKAKHEADIRAAEDKAKKLASLSESERREEEARLRIAELERRELEVQTKEYRLEAVKQLGEVHLSAAFADMVLAEEPEKTAENIRTLRAQIDMDVEAEVKKRLAGKSPDGGNSSPSVSAGETVAKERNETKKIEGFDPWKK